MFESSLYGLRPPCNEDIGVTMMEQQLMMPMSMGYIPGVSGTMNNVKINGDLKADSLEFTKDKNKRSNSRTVKWILAIGGTIIALPLLRKGFSAIKGMFKKPPVTP